MVKSFVRIVAGTCFVCFIQDCRFIILGGLLLVIAEVIGVVEEMV